MRRRDFLASSCLVGLSPLAAAAGSPAGDNAKKKQLLELRTYRFSGDEQRRRFAKVFQAAAVPALNRIGIKPVGAFLPVEDGDDLVLYALLPHDEMRSVVTANTRLLEDEQFVKAADAWLTAPIKEPAYERLESSLSLAFDDCPRVEVPTSSPTRVLQLRIYESHNIERAKKKVAMFNEGGEIALFRKTGLPPVFFGETLIGSKMPNLTYMLSFENKAAQEKGWKTFINSPEWDKLKSDPQYKDTVSNITNIVLRPAPGSQI